MSDARRKFMLNSLKLLDIAVMICSFAFATLPVLYENESVSFAEFFSMRVKVQNFLLFLGLLVAWHFIFRLLGIYETTREVGRKREILIALEASFAGSLCLGVVAALSRIRMTDLAFFFVFWASSSALAVAGRLTIQFFLDRARRHGRHLRNALVIGTNPRAVEIAQRIESQTHSGFRVLGFADDPWEGFEAFRKNNPHRLLCNLNGLADYFRRVAIDEVVMALPLNSYYHQASRIAAICEEQGIVMSMAPSIFNLRVAHSRAEDFEGESVVTLYTSPLDGWSAMAKRTLDFAVSLIALAFLAPLMLVVAILIKLFSPGPVLFAQERLGLNKHRFRIFKFRTMIPNAEQAQVEVESLNEVTGPVFKIKNDPRITPLGKFLRKTSLDELPQLFNVLKGDMSLVGPRPLPVRDYEGFDQDWHRRRFSVRPGITCLWQVMGRSSIAFEKWMELDMQYIDHWSLWLDFKILVDTIPAVLKGSGAA